MGAPEQGTQDYSRNVRGIYLPGSLHSYFVLLFFSYSYYCMPTNSLLYSWGSLVGIPGPFPFLQEIFPALLDLVAQRFLPEQVVLVGVGRSKRTSEEFRQQLPEPQEYVT